MLIIMYDRIPAVQLDVDVCALWKPHTSYEVQPVYLNQVKDIDRITLDHKERKVSL